MINPKLYPTETDILRVIGDGATKYEVLDRLLGPRSNYLAQADQSKHDFERGIIATRIGNRLLEMFRRNLLIREREPRVGGALIYRKSEKTKSMGSVGSVLEKIKGMDAQQVEDLLNRLGDYFVENQDNLTNMKARLVAGALYTASDHI